MTAALDQDFVTYIGDTVRPIFTVLNQANAVVNIATVNEITWTARSQEGDAALITKTKTGGAITFVTNGSDGKFQVTIGPTDVASLSGFYLHSASITDSNNFQTTVTIGRMQVGLAPQWTYNPKLLGTNRVYQVRRLIGDVLPGDKQLNDADIQFYVDNYPNVWIAAANACRAIAAQYARQVDTIQGELRTLYGQRTRNYTSMAVQLEQQGKGRSSGYVYAGGISVQDKQAQIEDTDRVPPQFNVMIFDNLLPITPIGQQTPGTRLPEVFNG